jgi:hypothetical protein
VALSIGAKATVRFEQSGLLFLGDTDAVILHLYHQAGVLLPDSYRDISPFRGELGGIVHQVEQYLLQSLPVTPDDGEGTGQLGL